MLLNMNSITRKYFRLNLTSENNSKLEYFSMVINSLFHKIFSDNKIFSSTKMDPIYAKHFKTSENERGNEI